MIWLFFLFSFKKMYLAYYLYLCITFGNNDNFNVLGRFRRNIRIALTLMVRLPENFIIVSPIMAPKPQNHPPFKSLYMLGGGGVSQVCWCTAGRNVQPNTIKFGTKCSLDVNKN